MSRTRTLLASLLIAALATTLSAAVPVPVRPLTAPPGPPSAAPTAAPAATPTATPPATSPGTPLLSDLKIQLMDGSLLTGKLSVATLDIDTKFGALKVPLEQIQSFAPGLSSHPQFQQNLSNLITDLSSEVFADREKAQQTLTKLGPDIRPELERQLKGSENEKLLRLQKIIDDLDSQSDDEIDKSRVWTRDDVIITPGFSIVGHITTPGFSINSNYGTLQIKLEDVRLARRDAAAPEDIRKTVSVPGTCFASRQYINTSIKLAKGDQVFITASGTVQMTPWNRQSTPDGEQNFGQMGNGIFGGTLVARLGDSGAMIKIGSKANFTASQAGVLNLGIASQSNYEGNAFPGEYEVKIRVVKK